MYYKVLHDRVEETQPNCCSRFLLWIRYKIRFFCRTLRETISRNCTNYENYYQLLIEEL